MELGNVCWADNVAIHYIQLSLVMAGLVSWHRYCAELGSVFP